VYPTSSSSPAFKEQQHQPSTSPLLPNDDSSSNHSATALFETKVQRFACDRENMQQYWIPEGFHPVLIPRAYLNNNSLVNSNNRPQPGDFINQLRSRINNNDNINDIELRRRSRIINDIFPSCNNNGGITKKKRRNNDVNRRVLSQSSPTVNSNHPLMYNQKVKDRITAIRNSAVVISSNSSLKNNNNSNIIIPDKNSPSIIIGEMWKDEPENIKKHYERLAIRKKIAQVLAFEKKFSSLNSGTRSTTINSRRLHVNPTNNTGSCRYNVHSNAIKGVDAVDCDNVVHHNVDRTSSPNNFNDWISRSNVEDDENSCDFDLGVF